MNVTFAAVANNGLVVVSGFVGFDIDAQGAIDFET
jgi:hypothetical protein